MAISRLLQTTLQNGFEKYNQVWDGRSAVGAMEPISSITLSAAQSSVEFNNIPGTYSHLQLRILGRDGRSSVSVNTTYLYINGDTGSNYSYHALYTDGTTSVATGLASNTFAVNHQNTSASAAANTFGTSIIDILDYSNTNKNKTIRSFSGYDDNSTGRVTLWSSLWMSTSAITSVVFVPAVSASFQQYSSFSLYGIK
jgi:hypothetical protein